MGNIYYVEFNFLNLKCYVFKMFLPNFKGIEWKMEKQQLFPNSLFLALFILTWEKYDVIVTSLLIWFGFFHRKLFILSESNSVQNLSSLTLKTKELWKGGGKHPSPPQCYNETKKPSAYRVKLPVSISVSPVHSLDDGACYKNKLLKAGCRRDYSMVHWLSGPRQPVCGFRPMRGFPSDH